MTVNESENPADKIAAPLLALDLGEKRVGVAVSDALAISITRLEAIPGTNWKRLLQVVSDLVQRFDAQTLVIGLPLRLNGSTGDEALKVRELAMKFAISLRLPVYLQDERLTSMEAEQNLQAEGHKGDEITARVDSEAAAIILRDFLVSGQKRILLTPSEQPL